VVKNQIAVFTTENTEFTEKFAMNQARRTLYFLTKNEARSTKHKAQRTNLLRFCLLRELRALRGKKQITIFTTKNT